MPKIDLHRHLEGTLRLQTLADIALEHGIDLPSYRIDDLRRFATVADDPYDFQRFLEKFTFLRRFYTSREAVERIAAEAVADAAADHVRYLELRFNPVALARQQSFSLGDVTDWVCEAVARAARDTGLDTNLIVQIGRDEPLETARALVEVALAHRAEGVVGIDLAGDEKRHPAAPYGPLFQQARRDGLCVTVHAGEAGGAANVREAIELLGAQRIGHGLRAIDDPAVMALAIEQDVAFEMCPTSNLQTGAVSGFGMHPLVDMLGMGARVTINTDDPSVSDTTLTDEYLVVTLAMGVTAVQLKTMILTAAEASFQSDRARRILVERLRQELAQFPEL